jgi:hypothetical protein
MMTIRRLGTLVMGAGLLIGFGMAAVAGMIGRNGAHVGLRIAMRDVGISSWMIALFVGIPVWFVGVLLERRRRA